MFQTPHPISDAYAAFMGLPAGSKVSRHEMTVALAKYAREHNLRSSEQGQTIQKDTTLIALLDLAPSEELTILNLNNYLQPHILTSTVAEFDAWWKARDQPSWVGIHLDLDYTWHQRQYATLYNLFANKKYKGVTVVIYTGIAWNDAEGEGPCGCAHSPCDYHRLHEPNVALCGCSTKYTMKCAYHAELDVHA
jgi:hypothetical protein